MMVRLKSDSSKRITTSKAEDYKKENNMNSDQHREVATCIDQIENLIKKLTGFPSDTPFCFKKQMYDKDVRQSVLSYIKEMLKYQQSANFYNERANNTSENIKFHKLIYTIIECLE